MPKHDSYAPLVTPKIAPAFALLYHSRFQRQWQTHRFKRKQTRENVCGLCLDANRCKARTFTCILLLGRPLPLNYVNKCTYIFKLAWRDTLTAVLHAVIQILLYVITNMYIMYVLLCIICMFSRIMGDVQLKPSK